MNRLKRESHPEHEALFKKELEVHLRRLSDWHQTQLQKQSAQKEKMALEIARRQAAEQQEVEEEQRRQEEEQFKQKQLEAAKAELSEMGAEFFDEMQQNNWEVNKEAFIRVGIIENWLDRLEENKDSDTIRLLKMLIDIHFKGLLENPDKVKGKKKKAVYSERMRTNAHRLIAFD